MSEKQKWTCCCGSEIGEVIDLFRQPNGFVNITMACGQCGKIWTFVGHATTVTYGSPCTTDVDVVEDIYTLPKAARRRRETMLSEWDRHKWLQVGTVVDYHAILGGPITKAAMVVREPAQRLPGGQWVCWLRGKAGCVSCESVTPVAP